MAHLSSSYASYETFLNGADAYWLADLSAMNNSGVTGTVLLAQNTEDDGTQYLNVSILAEGLTPNVQHAQHVHGAFDDNGNVAESRVPTLADDADKDGFVEVLEGLGAYGDILLPLVQDSGELPMTDRNGQLSFIQSYDLGDDSNFFSPVSMTDYTAEDLMPLTAREIVLHGQNVGSGFGAGTGGEIDGTQDGYVGLLPVAAGEITSTNKRQALDVLEDQFQAASDTFNFGKANNTFNAGAGNDTVFGGAGTDRIDGGADDDTLIGQQDNDVLRGGDGNDQLRGNAGNDRVWGGDGDDRLYGGTGADVIGGDDGADKLFGRLGTDTLYGGNGADIVKGNQGNDFLTGGNGRDKLNGGLGWDEFIYEDRREGRDVITDFEDGVDLINLNTLGMDFSDLTVEEARGGAASKVSFGATTIVMLDVTTDMVDAGDFIF